MAGLSAENSAVAAVYYVTADHIGTPQVITDTSQNVVWSGTQHPFGQVDVATSYIENNIRFPGQYYDKETGQHYNYFRDYDPSTGRYLQSDPIGLRGGINTYTYVGGNPVRYIDRYGLSPEDVRRIKAIFNQTVRGMTDSNKRTYPYVNNIRRNVESAIGGGGLVPYDSSKMGHFLQCHEQVTEVIDRLRGIKDFDDRWIFVPVDNGVGADYSHTWGEGRSLSNNEDPVIVFDPFYNEITP